MQGTSRISQATLADRLTELVLPPLTKSGAPSKGAAAVKSVAQRCDSLAADLFAVVDLLDQQGPLRRALTDPARPATAKSELITRLLGAAIGADAQSLLTLGAEQRWSVPRDLSDTLEELAVGAVVAGAEVTGVVEQVEAELFRFERTLAADRELLAALSDRSAEVGRRAQLVTDLVGHRALPATVTLVQRVVGAPRGRGLGPALQAYGRLAAQRRSQLVAVAKVAQPLLAEHRSRLIAALAAIYGKAIALQVDVDPTVLGGIRIEIGDEVLDGSIANKLAELDRRLAH